ncbi:hypothetical protein BH10PSE9_BH10PSE9_19760 [soil metagenome]
MKRILLGASFFVLHLAAPSAIAADYPYSGYFTSQETDMPPEEVQLACAFGFFRQDKDGAFIGYLIDRDRYVAEKTLRYEEYGRGKCGLDLTGKVETCTMTASADTDEVGISYYDVMRTKAADWVGIAMFDTEAQAKLYAAIGTGTPTAELRISRCIGFTEANLAPYLTDAVTTLTLDERGELLSPVVNGDNRPVMTEIREKINATR